MATFTGTGSNNSNFTGTLTVTESSYSVANNTSEVSYSLVLTGNSNYYFQQYYLTTKISINGTTVQDRYEQISMPSPSGGVSTYTVCSGTTTVQHNNDGTKTISVWATMSTVTTQTFLPGTINMPSGLNGSLTLTTIPRASTMTVPTVTIGSTGTFTVTAASNSFTHTITYSFGGLTGTAATLNAGVSSATWTPPNTFYAKLPNSTSGTVSYVLHTFSGATEVGSKSYSGTVKVGTDIKPTVPTITLSPVNTNAWINTQGLYVGGYTKLRVQSSATAGTGATISTYTISGPVSGSGADFTSSKALAAGSKTVRVTVADSRGRTNYNTKNVTFLSYSNPTLSTFKAVRGTYSGGSWTTSETGDHIRVQAVGSVSLSSQGNTGTITVKVGGANPNATSGNYYYFTSTDSTHSYTVTGVITDSVGNSTTRGLTVPTVAVPLNINVNLPGIGMGMIAQAANRLELAQDWCLVANGKYNRIPYLPYSWSAVGSSGSAGYARIATITVTGTWLAQPVCFNVKRALDNKPVNLYLRFANENSTDPSTVYLYYDSIEGTYTGQAFEAFAFKTATSVWDIFVRKCSSGDVISVSTDMGYFMQERCNVTYVNDLRGSVPGAAIVAIPIENQIYSYNFLSVAAAWNNSITTKTDGIVMRSGNTVTLYIRFTSPSSVVGGQEICYLPTGYAPYGINKVVTAVKAWAVDSNAPIQIQTNGTVKFVSTNFSASTDYIVSDTWITNDVFPT